jgi:hypothetical protein
MIDPSRRGPPREEWACLDDLSGSDELFRYDLETSVLLCQDFPDVSIAANRLTSRLNKTIYVCRLKHGAYADNWAITPLAPPFLEDLSHAISDLGHPFGSAVDLHDFIKRCAALPSKLGCTVLDYTDVHTKWNDLKNPGADKFDEWAESDRDYEEEMKADRLEKYEQQNLMDDIYGPPSSNMSVYYGDEDPSSDPWDY